MNFARVREAFALLDRAAATARPINDVAHLERVLSEDEDEDDMTKKKQTAFRLPDDLVVKLDAYAAAKKAAEPGLTFTRADAVRVLLTRALSEATTTTPTTTSTSSTPATPKTSSTPTTIEPDAVRALLKTALAGGRTQREIAAAVDVNVSRVSRFASGHGLSPESLARLYAYLRGLE